MREMTLLAVGLEPRADSPLLLLQERDGDRRVLAMEIGLAEAAMIEVERRSIPFPRPLCHQLVGDVLNAFGRRLDRVDITEVRERVLAELVLDREVTVAARVSDAVALAVRHQVPIRAAELVLDRAGTTALTVRGPAVDQRAAGRAFTEEDVNRFSAELNGMRPDDFPAG